MIIEIIIKKDYDNFFENWIEVLKEELNRYDHNYKKIIVTAGPYRNHGMEYLIRDDIINIDFYSAIRNGFGSIGCTPKELAEEILQL